MFHKTISIINRRSQLLLEKLHPDFIPRMKTCKEQGKLKDKEIESLEASDRENKRRLKDLTDKIIQHVNEAIASTKYFGHVSITMTQRYAHHSLISLTLIPD